MIHWIYYGGDVLEVDLLVCNALPKWSHRIRVRFLWCTWSRPACALHRIVLWKVSLHLKPLDLKTSYESFVRLDGSAERLKYGTYSHICYSSDVTTYATPNLRWPLITNFRWPVIKLGHLFPLAGYNARSLISVGRLYNFWVAGSETRPPPRNPLLPLANYK